MDFFQMLEANMGCHPICITEMLDINYTILTLTPRMDIKKDKRAKDEFEAFIVISNFQTERKCQ